MVGKKRMFYFFAKGFGLIRSGIVRNHNMEIGVVLTKYALDGLPHKTGTIAG